MKIQRDLLMEDKKLFILCLKCSIFHKCLKISISNLQMLNVPLDKMLFNAYIQGFMLSQQSDVITL